MSGPREYQDGEDVSDVFDVMSDQEETSYDPGEGDDDQYDPDDSAEDEEEPELAADDDSEGDESDEDSEEGDEDEEGPAPIDPPANWPQQEQQFFKELPPELQHAYLARARHMTADYTRKTQELAQVRHQYQEFDRVIGPRVQQWALNGMGPAQAIQQLIALSDYATNSPQEFIKYFANLRGVDLQQLAQPSMEEYIDPQVKQLRNQLAQVQAHLNQSSQVQQMQMQQQQVAQYQQAFNVTNSAIDNFASQVGQDGKPLYPYFNDLEEDMAIEIESGRARTVHEAYERAKWANPFTRSKLLAQQRSSQNARQRQRAQEARRAASSLSGSSAAYGSPHADGLSIRDTLEGVMNGSI